MHYYRHKNRTSFKSGATDKNYTHDFKLSSARQPVLFFRRVLSGFYYLLIFFAFSITYIEITSDRNSIIFQHFHKTSVRQKLIFFIRLFHCRDNVLGSLKKENLVRTPSIFIAERQRSNEYYLIIRIS